MSDIATQYAASRSAPAPQNPRLAKAFADSMDYAFARVSEALGGPSSQQQHSQRIDDYHYQKLDSFGWSVRYGYRITQVGVPNSRQFGANNPDADGTPHKVKIINAVLISENRSHELALPLHMIPSDLLADMETEIAHELDSNQAAGE